MEELITEAVNKGSVTSGGPSACGTPEGFFAFYKEICRKIYHENERILGKVILDAKSRIITRYYPDNDRYYGPAVVWTLMGDPAIRIKYPVPTDIKQKQRVTRKITRCFLSYGSNIKCLVDGEVSLYNSKGRVIYQNIKAKKGMIIPLTSGVYFISYTYRNTKSIHKVLLMRNK
jgi:hypothetical protein